MLENMGAQPRPMAHAKAVNLQQEEEKPTSVSQRSVIQRLMTLIWFLWGELTGEKRIFPG